MSESQHSPGPWQVHGVLVRDSANLPIADAFGRESDPIHQANVRLIAAAPDLLAACEIALADLKDGGNDDGKAGDALKAAIALVRGDAA